MYYENRIFIVSLFNMLKTNTYFFLHQQKTQYIDKFYKLDLMCSFSSLVWHSSASFYTFNNFFVYVIWQCQVSSPRIWIRKWH